MIEAKVGNIDNSGTTVNTSVPIDSDGYATYTSSVYNFNCKYPSWFEVQDTNMVLL